MNTNARNSIEGLLPILSASLLLVFWGLFAAFLPMTEPYVQWVLDSDWTWINLIGFTGSMLGIFALIAIARYKGLDTFFEIIAFGSSVVGVGFLTSLLFFEAFIVRGIATSNPELINPSAGFYRETVFKFANLTGGLLYSVGILSLSGRMIVQKTFRRWKLILLMIGAPLFAITLVPGNLRIVGVLFSTIAFNGMGIEMLRTHPAKGLNAKPENVDTLAPTG